MQQSDAPEQKSPAFDEPWQAQAYAMSQVLLENGMVKPEIWAISLGKAIKTRLESGAKDTTETYFQAVTDALVSVLSLGDAELMQTIEAWRAAYETTPHGKPVILAGTTN